MNLLDKAIVMTMPLAPRFIVRRVASRYVAGEDLASAARCVRELNSGGAMATMDLLGEEVLEKIDAEDAVQRYLRMLDTIDREHLDCNVSLKLSQLGLRIDEDYCVENVARIAERASKSGNFVRVDMEDHTRTDVTLRVYRAVQSHHGNLGVVLQSMLHRTADDVETSVGEKSNVRLCKGIYREPARIAFQEPQAIRESYVAALNRLLEGGCYVGIATHDEVLVEAAMQTVRRLGLSRHQYEFQMLLGVTPTLRQRVLDDGHRLRVYVPYGRDWYPYSIRRLRENPTVALHVMRAMVFPG
jgi:proline dehydrogenase